MSFLSGLVEQLFALPGSAEAASYFLVEGIWQYFNFVAVLSLAVLLYVAPSIVQLLRKIPKAVCIDVCVLTALGFILRIVVSPHLPQVFLDEIDYIELSNSLRSCGRYIVEYYSPPSEQVMPFFPAWPFVLAWWGKVFPTSFVWISAFCGVIASASIPLAYAIAWRLRAQRCFAVALASLVATWPLHLRLSGCSALENGSFTLLLLVTLCLLLWAESKLPRWLFAAMVVWVWFSNWRMENAPVLTPLLLVCLVIAVPSCRQLFRTPLAYLLAFVALLMSWPGFLCDIYGIHSKFYLTDVQSVSINSALVAKFSNNWMFWIEDGFHPNLYTLLAALALFVTWRQRLTWVGLLWFLTLNLFYGVIPTADFSSIITLDSWRNSLYPAWGLFLMVAMFLTSCWTKCETREKCWRWGFGVIASVILVSLPLIKLGYISEQTWLMREYELAERVGSRLPQKAFLFVSHSEPQALAIWRYTTKRDWLEYVLPESAFGATADDNCPVLLQASRTWLKDGERIFILVATRLESFDDELRSEWLLQNYKLRVVDADSSQDSDLDYKLYEVDGLSDEALAWIKISEKK